MDAQSEGASGGVNAGGKRLRLIAMETGTAKAPVSR